MPAAKKPKENVSKRPIKNVEGMDAKVVVNIFSPDHQPKEFVIDIPYITGCTNVNHRRPEDIHAKLVAAMQKAYGLRVK